MKLRSLMLVLCMVVVPFLAMFSHQFPTAVRTKAHELLLAPLRELVAAVAQVTADSQAADSPSALLSADTRLPGPLLAAPTGSAEAGLGPPPPPLEISNQPPIEAPGRAAAGPAEQLAALGAMRLTLDPATAPGQPSRGSCRLPVDDSGQLHRLFQSVGPDEQAVLADLVQQVLRWKQRMTNRPVEVPVATRDAPLRF
jgi:hypothetical protein